MKLWMCLVRRSRGPGRMRSVWAQEAGIRGCLRADIEVRLQWSNPRGRPAGTRRWAALRRPSSSTEPSARKESSGSPGETASGNHAPLVPVPLCYSSLAKWHKSFSTTIPSTCSSWRFHGCHLGRQSYKAVSLSRFSRYTDQTWSNSNCNYLVIPKTSISLFLRI